MLKKLLPPKKWRLPVTIITGIFIGLLTFALYVLKAQEFVGLDMKQLNAEKQEFLQTVVPEWMKEAEKREKTYDFAIKNKE